jgi:hypothetical protein
MAAATNKELETAISPLFWARIGNTVAHSEEEQNE